MIKNKMQTGTKAIHPISMAIKATAAQIKTGPNQIQCTPTEPPKMRIGSTAINVCMLPIDGSCFPEDDKRNAFSQTLFMKPKRIEKA